MAETTTLSMSPPAFSGETTEQKIDAISNYLFLLEENLRFILENLGPENFNAKELAAFGFGAGKAEVDIDTVTDALYSRYGPVADLTVYELRTDYQRAQRYKNSDTGDLYYLHIRGEEIRFIKGTVIYDPETGEPLTEQLHRGSRYFWWTSNRMQNMSFLNKSHYPVTVYQYDETVLGAYKFDVLGSGKAPELVFGEGYGASDANRGRGFLQRGLTGLDMWLLTSAGQRHGVFIGDPYTDIVGLRKTTEIDFSHWDAGLFTEIIDGDLSARYLVEFDAQDRPIKITDAAGHETDVVWE